MNYDKDKIYCANCLNCKLFHQPLSKTKNKNGIYLKRVKCDAGNWFTWKGNEKTLKYYTIYKKTMDECKSYKSMSDNGENLEDYMTWLESVLPENDVVYFRGAQE